MRAFDYLRPGSTGEATSSSGEAASFVAGGTNLLDLMKLEVMTPEKGFSGPPCRKLRSAVSSSRSVLDGRPR